LLIVGYYYGNCITFFLGRCINVTGVSYSENYNNQWFTVMIVVKHLSNCLKNAFAYSV